MSGRLTVYRGVAGRGAARRIAGRSWTDDLDAACWFAIRFDLQSPAVYTGELAAHDVWAFVTDRSEREFIGQPRLRERMPLTETEIHDRGANFKRRINEANQKRLANY
jgi:hypothetical protein